MGSTEVTNLATPLYEHVLAADTQMALNFITENPEQAAKLQDYAEQELAIAGAELSLNFHTPEEKEVFADHLTDYLKIINLRTNANLQSRIQEGEKPTQAVVDVIRELKESKRRVLRRDIDYRLATSKRERVKEKVANSPLTRLLGKAALYGGQGFAFYLVGKGFIDSGSTHNYLLAASAASAQISGRAFGQELARQGNLQIDEYTPVNDGKDVTPEDDLDDGIRCKPLARHEAHLAVSGDSLFAVAGRYAFDVLEDRENLVNDLTNRLGDWYRLYYKQPTFKDRLNLIAWGGTAALTAGLTVLQI